MPTKRNRQDIYVYTLLLTLGGLQLALSCRTSEFAYDPYYYELAQSILANTGYGFNGRPEPMLPPGFPALLALLIVIVGHSYAVLIRSMALFTTLGLIAAYEILKSQEGRRVAAVVCLLLASSPSLFEFSTRMLFSDMPYFFFSMFLLWAVTRFHPSINRARIPTLWWTLCVLLLLASILVRSTGIALAGGIFGWLAISLFRERKFSKSRFAIFLPLVIVGLIAEAAWLSWSERHPVSQWPVHGFQESYVAQLKLKNGNNPELGMATWQDLLKRPLENEDDMVTSMVTLFTHKQIAPAWYSPTTVIPLTLLVIGLAYSFRRTGGGITEWYFVGYQCLFLFWPWNFELRFQLPVAPLAALYMWKGGRSLWGWARCMPRKAATSCLIVSALGVLSSWVWGWHTRHPLASVCVAIWLLVGCSSTVLLSEQGLLKTLFLVLESSMSVRGVAVSRAEMAGGIAMTSILAAGVWVQTLVGVENLHRIPEMDPNIEAAEWIRGNSAVDDVVMARWESSVYHYSGRRVIWFPPSTDPHLLRAGICRYHIRLIVVTEEDDSTSYWKPSDSHCFRALSCAYPSLFRLVHQGRHEQVYKVCGEMRRPTDHVGTS